MVLAKITGESGKKMTSGFRLFSNLVLLFCLSEPSKVSGIEGLEGERAPCGKIGDGFSQDAE